jgi:hypothetical protein
MTVAVSVTTVPEETEVAALPPLVTASVVVVAVCAEAGMAMAIDATRSAIRFKRTSAIRGPVELAIIGTSISAIDLRRYNCSGCGRSRKLAATEI